MSLQLRRLVGDQRGVTGLETAIILIAFVVVASVFAFTVLSTGIFSAERGKETIHAGLKEARSSAELKGSVTANGVADKTLSLGDTAWFDNDSGTSTNFTVTASTTNKKEGMWRAGFNVPFPNFRENKWAACQIFRGQKAASCRALGMA